MGSRDEERFACDHRDKIINPTLMSQEPRCKRLVLDAGPLLSLSPLRGLAETYLTVPQVLAELKDNRAREHFERLGLISGIKVEIRSPDAASLSHGV
jgi:RNA-binding protein NOB1